MRDHRGAVSGTGGLVSTAGSVTFRKGGLTGVNVGGLVAGEVSIPELLTCNGNHSDRVIFPPAVQNWVMKSQAAFGAQLVLCPGSLGSHPCAPSNTQ